MKFLRYVIAGFLLTAGIIFMVRGISALAASNPPVCQLASVEENSGNGPNYPVKVCNSGGPALTRLPAGHHWVFIVDGGALPEHNRRIATVIIAEVK